MVGIHSYLYNLNTHFYASLAYDALGNHCDIVHQYLSPKFRSEHHMVG